MDTGVGTPAFMPPEVIVGAPDAPTSAASPAGNHPAASLSSGFAAPTDVFSYGMLLLAMWTRRAPFATSESDVPPPFVVMSKIAAGERPAFPPGMPRALVDLVRACWAQDPRDRPTMVEAIGTLKGAVTAVDDASATCGARDAAAMAPADADAAIV